MPVPKLVQQDSTRLLIRQRTWIWPVFFFGFVGFPLYFYVSFFFDTGRIDCDDKGGCTLVRSSIGNRFRLSFKLSDIQSTRLLEHVDGEGDLLCRTELKIKGRWIPAHLKWGERNKAKKKAYRSFLKKVRSRRAFSHDFSTKLHWTGHLVMVVFFLVGLLSTWFLTRQSFIDIDLRNEKVTLFVREVFLFDKVQHTFFIDEVEAVEVGQGADGDGDSTFFLEFHLQDGQVLKANHFESPENKRSEMEDLRNKIVQALLGL